MERRVIRSDFHLHHRHSGSHSRIPADPSSHQFGTKGSRFSEVTIRDRYGGQISVPGGSNLRTFVLFSTRLHSSKDTKKPESSFLELSDFFTGDIY